MIPAKFELATFRVLADVITTTLRKPLLTKIILFICFVCFECKIKQKSDE